MLKKVFARLLEKVTVPAGRLLVSAGVSPNAITVAGFLVTLVSAVLIVQGKLVAGGIVLWVGAILDLIDGAAAKSSGRATPAGAFLDSTLDRFSDGLILGGIAVHFLRSADGAGPWLTGGLSEDRAAVGVVLALSALVLGFAVSYIKARAQSLGFSCDVGLAERAERLVLPGLGLIFGGLLMALAALAALSAITVLQRFVHVWRQAKPA